MTRPASPPGERPKAFVFERSSLELKFGMGARLRVLRALNKFARNCRAPFSSLGTPKSLAKLKSNWWKWGPGKELRPIGGPPRGKAVVKQLSVPALQLVRSVGKFGSFGAVPVRVFVVGQTPLMKSMFDGL